MRTRFWLEGSGLSLDRPSPGRLRSCAIEVVARRVRNSGHLSGICGAAGLRRCDSAHRLHALDALGVTERALTHGCLGAEKEPGNGRWVWARITCLALSNHLASVDGLPRWPGVVLAERTARTIGERGLRRTEGPFVRRRFGGVGHAPVDFDYRCGRLAGNNPSRP